MIGIDSSTSLINVGNVVIFGLVLAGQLAAQSYQSYGSHPTIGIQHFNFYF